MVASGMTIKVFEGRLGHKNPSCEQCGSHTYALYRGGKKERLDNAFVCKTCCIIYKLPTPKKCEFSEVIA